MNSEMKMSLIFLKDKKMYRKVKKNDIFEKLHVIMISFCYKYYIFVKIKLFNMYNFHIYSLFNKILYDIDFYYFKKSIFYHYNIII